ncbi:substrate-binding domain-containing protein [Enterovibrio sp. ZSDZ35]|uniref:Substrate-binding domain-containing protein n=1 Tax=Enterovibrio qingdaonensis TaxID=2899818 RepID=A0ABT5QQP2_9GAMM|nr:substrate-binding domain-containing protein [Enterovibrio sp. ZSDZ35]MDD1782611.1 substrate-binding domain-containing protein [Enterovibrio sp. ZSDZ35]
MATIKDVAREAGVSVATVSRVINKSPKASQSSIDSVSLAMKQLGYRPNAAARALVSQSTNTVGVLVSDVSDPFFGSMIKAIDQVARENGKHILIGNGYHKAEDERHALELLINARCEAIIVHAKGLSDEELIGYAKEVKGMVIINRHIPEIAERCIALDNRKGAYLATDFLIRHGHRNIACIASAQDIEDTEQRLDGYLAALKDNGVSLSKSYIEYGEVSSDGGEIAMTNLLSKSLSFTAVVAYNDYMAAGALAALDQNGIAVPSKMSIVGFDDGLIARFVHPSLTTIRYPIEIMAERASRLALALSKNAEIEDETAIFSPTLVRRNSVASL